MKDGSGAEWLITWFDACMGQCNNWAHVMFRLLITDPDLGMHMYVRMDDKIPMKGHTYLQCDRGFGEIIREGKGRKIISDMQDWIEIAKKSNRKNPPCVTEFKQELHYDWVLCEESKG